MFKSVYVLPRNAQRKWVHTLFHHHDAINTTVHLRAVSICDNWSNKNNSQFKIEKVKKPHPWRKIKCMRIKFILSKNPEWSKWLIKITKVGVGQI